MIRLCTGEVYNIYVSDYNETNLIAWFSDNHQDALVQLLDDNDSYAGIITYPKNQNVKDIKLTICPYFISLNRDLFDNAYTFFKKTGLKYCPILNSNKQLELFCYNDQNPAWNKLVSNVAQIGAMKNPAGIFEGYDCLNLWGLNEIGFHLALIFEDNPNLQLCCIGEYWDYLGFSSVKKQPNSAGYHVLLEGNYAIPLDEMGYWQHDAVNPDLFEDLLNRIKQNIHSKHAYGERFCSISEGRSLLSKKIESSLPFCSGRLGHTEGWITMKYICNLPYDQHSLWWLYHTSGFFSEQDVNLKDVNLYAQKTIEALSNTDILFSQFDDSMSAINHCLPTTSPIFPFKGLWHDSPYSDDDISWIQSLKGKKVLVISPFSDTIATQYQKRELLFKGNQVLPEFELIPFCMISTQYGNKLGFKNFFEAYHSTLNKISKIDFDIALIGAGAYGFLLASDIKNMGKQSVELCSYLMPLFGIKIKRNLTEPDINQFYNPYWIFPMEKPINNYQNIENGCYWR